MKYFICREDPGVGFSYLNDIPVNVDNTLHIFVWSKTFSGKRFPLEPLDHAKELRSAIDYHHKNSHTIFHIINEHNELIA